MNVVIGLNVGGEVYKTTRDTLTKFPKSELGSKFYERIPKEKDVDGNFILDRDGPLFRYVLNFLRNKKLALPDDFCEFGQLTLEAKFYQIPGLLEAVKQAERNSSHMCSTTYLTAEYVTDSDTEKKRWQIKSTNIDVLWRLALHVQPDFDTAPKKCEENDEMHFVEIHDMAKRILFDNIWSLGFVLNTVKSEQELYEFVKRS